MKNIALVRPLELSGVTVPGNTGQERAVGIEDGKAEHEADGRQAPPSHPARRASRDVENNVSRGSARGVENNGEPPPRLADIDLKVAPGEWLYLAGTNGSGKTTLARLLAGLSVELAAGSIDRGFAGAGPSPYVMQQPESQLFGETPREEIIFALEWLGMAAADIPAAAERMLEETGLLPLADRSWDRLSGGQRQLAAVAAAAAGEAPLYVFDEATSMLDEASRQRVRHAAEQLHKRGSAVVWVTQRLSEIAPEARVAALFKGRLAYDGTGRGFMFGSSAADGGEAGGIAGEAAGLSPCERCGLRLPYLAKLTAELNRLGGLPGKLPMTDVEWRKELTGE